MDFVAQSLQINGDMRPIRASPLVTKRRKRSSTEPSLPRRQSVTRTLLVDRFSWREKPGRTLENAFIPGESEIDSPESSPAQSASRARKKRCEWFEVSVTSNSRVKLAAVLVPSGSQDRRSVVDVSNRHSRFQPGRTLLSRCSEGACILPWGLFSCSRKPGLSLPSVLEERKINGS